MFTANKAVVPAPRLNILQHGSSKNQNLTHQREHNLSTYKIVQQAQATENFIHKTQTPQRSINQSQMNFADFPQPGSWKFRQINNELVSAGETKILSNQISRNKIGQSNQANQPKQRNHSHHLNMASAGAGAAALVFNVANPPEASQTTTDPDNQTDAPTPAPAG